MSKFQNTGVLTPDERRAQGEKCVRNLLPHVDNFRSSSAKGFITGQDRLLKKDIRYSPTQSQLNFMKNLLDEYDR